MSERKDCIRCGKRRTKKFFGKHTCNTDGLRRWCKQCESNYSKTRHPYFRRYRAEKRIKLAEIKASTGCCQCGEKHPACLQFHHRDPKKKYKTISRLYAGTWSWERVLEEIKKCDVMCANCHLKLHGDEYESARIA